MYDVTIIGAGPAGLTAALYASRGNLKTLIIEKGLPGGQMMNTAEIENYSGFETILGPDLSNKMYAHATRFGAVHKYGEVLEITHHGKHLKVYTAKETYLTKTIIIATGAEYRKLGVDGEDSLRGRGVSYCAVCDGAFFKNKDIAVIGGGDSAIEEGNFLTKFAKSVTIIHRRETFRAQKLLLNRALENPKISFIKSATVQSIYGENKVEGIKLLKHNMTEESLKVDGVFIYVGLIPSTACFQNMGVLNNEGYVIGNSKMETQLPGVFAAGDVLDKSLRQIITATSDGAVAAQTAQHYIENL